MTERLSETLEAAEVVLPCENLQETLTFFIDRLGFRIEIIFPADSPDVAVISGHGLRLRLDLSAKGPAPRLRMVSKNPLTIPSSELLAPNGSIVEIVAAGAEVDLPPLKPSFVVSHMDGAEWSAGRAGMRYRDLIPGRQGGRFIASHIHIRDGGPVPDYTHFHKIHFQMIYCRKGWVRVVYEDQGEPFVMGPGDCVLQPPEIRHRVLECSSNLEVIELGCPAVHETWADHDLILPSKHVVADRLFSGQKFVRHIADEARWSPWLFSGFDCRDTGISEGTGGIAEVEVVRRTGDIPQIPPRQHHGQLLFGYLLNGTSRLSCDDQRAHLSAGDSFVVPPHHTCQAEACSKDFELLQITVN